MTKIDDLDVTHGQLLECTDNTGSPWFTEGHLYSVYDYKNLIDDNGNQRVPSAHFKIYERDENVT